MDKTKQNIIEEVSNSLGSSGISRKNFFKYTGAAGAAIATLGMVGCQDDVGGMTGPGSVYLGNGDIGVLNYAYALEQLEAAFYIQVESSPYGGMSSAEGKVFADIRDHEVAHRDFYTAALGNKAIPGLTPDFSSIDFNDRATVINTALLFENTGVSAYNGAASKLTNVDFLLVAGKIVSVEARHASAISDLAFPNAGVAKDGIIDANGLGLATPISDVLKAVNPFIVEIIDDSGITK